MGIEALRNEVNIYILSYLDPITLFHLSNVSKKLEICKQASCTITYSQSLVNMFWKQHYEDISLNENSDKKLTHLDGDSLNYKKAYIYQRYRIQRANILINLQNKENTPQSPKLLGIDSLFHKEAQFCVPKDTLKCVSVGDNGIGKSSALYTLFKNNFPTTTTKLGMEDGVYETLVEFNHKKVKVQIIDTSASRDEYDEMRPLIYPNMDIFFVFFAIDKPESWLNVIHRWVPEIEKKVKNPLKILIGTDCDLRNERLDLITQSEGQELAKALDFSLYMEVSSKMNETLKEMFENSLKVAYFVSSKKRSWLGNIFNTDLI